MLNLFRRVRRDVREPLILAALIATLLVASIATGLAQTYPTTTPTYNPNAYLVTKTFTAPGTYVYNLQGVSTLAVEVAGTNSGLVAEVDVTSDRNASPVWNQLAVGLISTDGNYRYDVAGFAQARVNVTALASGSAAVTMSGTQAPLAAALNKDHGAVISHTTLAAGVAGTYTSPVMTNDAGVGVMCGLSVSSSSGNPTETFAVQAYDTASNTYLTLLGSSTVTGNGAGNVPTWLYLDPAIPATLPTQTTANSIHVPRFWRVTETIGGTNTPGIIDTVSCQGLK